MKTKYRNTKSTTGGKNAMDNINRNSIGRMVVATVLILAANGPAMAQEPISDNQAVRAIVGEASNQGYNGMLALACGIRNRGTLSGVYGLHAKHVDKEPKWVWDMARRAWIESEHNRIHYGDHWENICAFGRPVWAEKMEKIYEYKDHVFYKSIN